MTMYCTICGEELEPEDEEEGMCQNCKLSHSKAFDTEEIEPDTR